MQKIMQKSTQNKLQKAQNSPFGNENSTSPKLLFNSLL